MAHHHSLSGTVHDLIEQVQRVQQHVLETLRDHKERHHLRQWTMLHEIKNALAGILSCAEILENFAVDRSVHEDFVRLIGDEFERIARLAQEYWKGVPTDPDADAHTTCSVQTVVEDVLKVCEPACSRQQIHLVRDVQYTGQIAIAADQMKQILVNILHNACEAMPDGGGLTICTAFVTDQVCITISDTGCGMSPELLACFLEPFVTAGKPHGTGLGMSVVRTIVEAHQGRLDVESHVGQGTIIRIWLPYA